MANNKKKNVNNEKMRIIILVFVGVIAFVVSVGMNIIGMKNAIEKKPDSSGMAGFSVRTKKSESLGTNIETKVNDEGKVIEDDILVNAVPIIKLNNNNWDRVKANFSGFKLDEDGNAEFDEGYKLFCNGTYVNYVVFDNIYQGEVLGHLKVGTDFKTIENKLGTPTFKTKEYLGYKTREVYVFFYKDEIAVYSNKKQSNKNLENFLKSYLEKTYQKGRTRFLVDIRNDYKDFIIEIDEATNIVTITSLVRQIVARLDSLGNMEVELYNGYDIALEDTQSLVDEKRYFLNDDDLVEVVESERRSSK